MLNEQLLWPEQSARTQAQVQRILSSVRRQLAMDVGFVSEFLGTRRVFRFVDSEPGIPIHRGGTDPLVQSCCYYVAWGLLPQVLTDARENPITSTLKATHELGEKELEVVRACADVVSGLVEDDLSLGNELREKRKRIDDLIESRNLMMVYQPIYRLADNRLMNFEALARVPGQPARPPEVWFSEAVEIGRGAPLELMAVEEALKGLPALPRHTSLSLNLSPEAILSCNFEKLFGGLPYERLIIELTEHEPVLDYDALRNRLAAYRSAGLRLAIDDVGAGYASFRHILDLSPDLIKLDTVLTRNIDSDIARQTLAKAITMFGRKMGCEVVAEGVETVGELEALRAIGATKVQGYLLGHPMTLDEAAALPSALKCRGRKPILNSELTGLRTAS